VPVVSRTARASAWTSPIAERGFRQQIQQHARTRIAVRIQRMPEAGQHRAVDAMLTGIETGCQIAVEIGRAGGFVEYGGGAYRFAAVTRAR
jgi:hypothetical protein